MSKEETMAIIKQVSQDTTGLNDALRELKRMQSRMPEIKTNAIDLAVMIIGLQREIIEAKDEIIKMQKNRGSYD